jgi:hypothetical protein
MEFKTIIVKQNKIVNLASNTQPEVLVSVFMSPSERVAQLYPQVPGSLLVTYDSQGYGRGILTRLHTVSICI